MPQGFFGARSPPGAVARRLGGDARGSNDGSKGACGGDGGSTARIERGRNEYHRNALRGIVKQGAIWSSGSNRANRTDSGAPQLTLDTPRPAAPAPSQARLRSCRRRATLAPALVGDRVTHSSHSLKIAGRADVAVTWHRRFRVAREWLEFSRNGRQIVRPVMI